MMGATDNYGIALRRVFLPKPAWHQIKSNIGFI
jgi:hypothetical protein